MATAREPEGAWAPPAPVEVWPVELSWGTKTPGIWLFRRTAGVCPGAPPLPSLSATLRTTLAHRQLHNWRLTLPRLRGGQTQPRSHQGLKRGGQNDREP